MYACSRRSHKINQSIKTDLCSTIILKQTEALHGNDRELLFVCYIKMFHKLLIITGLPNGPVLLCSLASVICTAAGEQAGRRTRERSAAAGQSATLHSGPVQLHSVKATPGFILFSAKIYATVMHVCLQTVIAYELSLMTSIMKDKY